MPLFIRIEALGVIELDAQPIRDQAVMQVMSEAHALPPVALTPYIPPSPEPFLTPTLVLA